MRTNGLPQQRWTVSGPTAVSTIAILAGLAFCYLTLPDEEPLQIFRYGAYCVGATLLIAFLLQMSDGFKSLLRPDSIALGTLYFLTYAEFLTPEVRVLRLTTTDAAVAASDLVMLGFAGLAIGRHIPLRFNFISKVEFPEVDPIIIYRLLLVFAAFGYLYVFIKVKFDVTEIISSLLNPRFDQPWQRGRLGDWSALLEQLNMLLYAVTAIAGYIFANRHLFYFRQKLVVVVILLFIMFFDFASGTRYVIMIRVGLFLLALLLAERKQQRLMLILVSAFCAIALLLGIRYMLEFRNMGLGAFLASGDATDPYADRPGMIDNNMYSIAGIIAVFPKYYDYSGLQVIWTALIHPIPRALWPGKPVDWSDSIETALNVRGATIAVTYVGEAYLIAGYWTAFIVSMLFGALAAAWTRVGQALRTNTGFIFYVSAFYAVTLGMRSMQWISVAILPTVAVYVVARVLPRSRIRRIVTRVMGARRNGVTADGRAPDRHAAPVRSGTTRNSRISL